MKRILGIMIAALALCTTSCARNDFESDTFTTKSGKNVTITFIKHGTLMIQVGDNYYIHIDPVINVGKKTDYTKMPKANAILVTHEHFDHYDTLAIKQASKSNTFFITNENVAKMYGSGEVMKNGSKITIDNNSISNGTEKKTSLTIEAVPAYNTTPANMKFHPKGRDNGYILTIDGLRIYISGDTEDIPEMSNLKDIDIAFLSVNQPYTMTPEQCIHAAKMIKPKILYPYHYNDTDVNKIVEGLKGTNIEVRIKQLQ